MGLIGAMRSAERERGGPLYPLYSGLPRVGVEDRERIALWLLERKAER